jgi:exopolysaccharide biosynthesis predicted pyruvyltransferase EpsI
MKFLYSHCTDLIDLTTEQMNCLLKQQGAEYDFNRAGIIIEPRSHAHVLAGLLGIRLIEGEWQDPVDV